MVGWIAIVQQIYVTWSCQVVVEVEVGGALEELEWSQRISPGWWRFVIIARRSAPLEFGFSGASGAGTLTMGSLCVH